MTEQSKTIAIPRPAPGEFVIAICDEDDDLAWITGSKATMGGDSDLFRQLVPFLEESQQVIRDQREAATASMSPAE
jgi:hypothetical protein